MAALLNDDLSALILTHERRVATFDLLPRWGEARAFRDGKTRDQVFRP